MCSVKYLVMFILRKYQYEKCRWKQNHTDKFRKFPGLQIRCVSCPSVCVKAINNTFNWSKRDKGNKILPSLRHTQSGPTAGRYRGILRSLEPPFRCPFS